MSVRVALGRGRKLAESLMTDMCLVRRATGETTTDPVTFAVTPTVETVYSGRCKVQSLQMVEREPEAAGGTATVVRSRVDFPVGAAVFLPGDVATVTGSGEPGLVGRHFRLTVPAPFKTHATANRVAAEELVGAEVPEWA